MLDWDKAQALLLTRHGPGKAVSPWLTQTGELFSE